MSDFTRKLSFATALVDVLEDQLPAAEAERLIALAKQKQRELGAAPAEVIVLRKRPPTRRAHEGGAR